MKSMLCTCFNKLSLAALSSVFLYSLNGISIAVAETETTGEVIDLSELQAVADSGAEDIEGPGPIVTVDDFRFSIFRIRGRQIDNSNLNYYVSDGLNSVSTYFGNSPINTNTGPGDFDHFNYFERYDVGQVEILEGANNTFYGNTSLGGVIRYLPNKPVLSEFSTHIGAAGNRLTGSEGGELGFSGDVTINVPMGEYLAFRFAGGRLKTEGSTEYRNLYQLNGAGEPINANAALGAPTTADFTSQDDVNSFFTSYGRASLLWKPIKDLEAILTFVHQSDDRGGTRVNTLGADGFGNEYGFNQSGSLITEPRQREANTGMIDLSWETDLFTLTSNTTLYDHKGSLVDDVTAIASNTTFLTSSLDFCENTPGFGFAGSSFCFATPYRLDSSRPLVVLNRSFEDEGFTQELRIESLKNKKLDYVAGLYFHDRDRAKNTTLDKIGFSTFFQANTPLFHDANSIQSDRWSNTVEDFETQEIATYGNATYKISDKFRAGFGLRAFRYESRSQVQRTFPMFNVAFATGPRFGTVSLDLEKNENGILPAFQLEYDLNKREQLYFNFDKGFRPGGVNSNALLEPSFLTYQSESSYNYEMGIRGHRGLDFGEYTRNMHYELSFFARSGHDQHITTFTGSRDTRDQLQTGVTVNADRTRYRGIEIKMQGDLTRSWGYAVDYVYMQEAELTKDLIQDPSRTFAGATSYTGIFNGAFAGQFVVGTGLSTSPFVLAADGTDIPFVPDHSLVLKTNYLMNFDSMTINLFGSAYAQSDINLSLTDSSRMLSGYTVLNAGVGFLWGGSALYLFVNNITDQKGALSEETATAGPSTVQNAFSSGASQGITLPRLIGATFTIDF